MNMRDDEDLSDIEDNGMSVVDDLEAHERAALEEEYPLEDDLQPETEREPELDYAAECAPKDVESLNVTIEEIHDVDRAIRNDRIAYRCDAHSRAALGLAVVALVEAFAGRDPNLPDLFNTLHEGRGLSFGEAARIVGIYERLVA